MKREVQRAGNRAHASNPSPMRRVAPLDLLLAGLIALSLLILYVRTLLPGIGTADSADLTTAAVSLGIPHPPGYPLYTLIGHLFSRISAENPAWGVNLLSAVAAAAAGAIMYLAALQWTGSRWAGLLAAAALALDPRVWTYATVAEVFSLNNLLAALILWLALRGKAREVPLIFLLYGLGASHHHTLAFTLPAVALLLFKAKIPWSPTRIITTAGAFCVGLLPYAYPLVRAQANPGLNWDDPSDLKGLIHLFLRKDYGTFSLMPAAGRAGLDATSPLQQIPVYLDTVFAQFAILLGLLAMVGLAAKAYQDRWSATAIFLAWLATGPIFLMIANCPLSDPYYLGVVERFYLLPQVPLALLMAAGAAFLARRAAWLGAILALATLALGLSRYEQQDQSQNIVGEEYMHNLLETLPENALFLTVGDGPTMLLEYAQFGLNRRPDVVVLDQDKLRYPWYVDTKRRNHTSVTFPWPAYDDGRSASLGELIGQNYGTRPILLWGALDSSVSQFRLLPAGLAQRVAEPQEKPTPDQNAEAVEALWSKYRKASLKQEQDPRKLDYLITSYYGFPFYSLGGEYEANGQPDKAEEYYRKAILAAPHYTLPHRQLGRLLLKQGRHAEARASLERYLELYPDAHDAAEIRSLLR